MKKILTTAFILALTGLMSLFAQNRIYTPDLLSPADMAFAQSPDVVLDWTAVTGGNTGIITYELYVDTDPEFPSAQVFVTEFVSGYQMEALDFGQKYYWKVRAKDGDQVSEWSETRSFIVIRRVVTTKPLEAALKQKPTLDLEWTAISGVEQYEYQFDTLGPWEIVEVPVTGVLNAAYAVDENNGWMVGAGGTVLYYDGTSIAEQTSNTTKDLMAVFFLDASNGWAVGKGGEIIYYNGTEWALQESGTTSDLNGVWFTDASNGWAVGKGGIILHYDGSVWSEDPYSGPNDLFAVTFSDADHGWAVGKSGAASIYEAGSWTDIQSNTPRDLYCVAVSEDGRGFAGGKSGIFLEFGNGAWAVYGNSITNKDINGMIISGNSGWAVGKTGTVIEFDGFEWFLSSAGTQTNLIGAALHGENGFVVGESGFAAMLTNNAFTSPMAEVIHHVAGDKTKTTVHDLLFGTTYYWRMRTAHSQDVSEWSGARSFQTMFVVELDKPNNNATNQNLDVELKWAKVVDNITYEIQVDDDMSFSSPIPLETENTAINAELLTFGTSYYWRVRAVHAHDVSDWPEPFMFTTACCVNLSSPANNETDVKLVPVLTWQALSGIGGYQVQLDDADNFSEPLVNVLVEGNGTNSVAVPTLLDKNKQYYWRVRAYKSIDSSDWSNVWSFITLGELGIDDPEGIAGLSLYPNPATDFLHIQMEENTSEPLLLIVTDLLGKPVLEETFRFNGSGKTQSMDVANLSKGIYLIQLRSGDRMMTRKLIITR